LEGLSYDDRSQAVILNKGMNIISKVNNEDIGIFNNQRFKIIKIGTFRINIEDDFKKLYEINITDFQKYFLPGYATTTHSAQGMSIGESYTIHEWDRMDQRLRYVALSRSRDLKYINIMK
jgi:ATP-dependent exoDNAse (exonuclease V) alpha subunit